MQLKDELIEEGPGQFIERWESHHIPSKHIREPEITRSTTQTQQRGQQFPHSSTKTGSQS